MNNVQRSVHPETEAHPSAIFSPYGPPECAQLHSDPLVRSAEPIDARYDEAKSARVSFHETLLALNSLRKKLVLLMTAEVKRVSFVN